MSANCSSASRLASGGRASGTHGVDLQVGPVELRQLVGVLEVDHPGHRIDEVVGDAQTLLQPCSQRARHRRGHLEAGHLAEPAPAELDLDRLEQVVGLVGDLEVGIARNAEERPLDDVHPGEERRQEVGEHLLERDEPAGVPDGQEARQALGHLHAREPLLAGLGIAREDGQAHRESGDVGKRLPGPDRERRQHGEDLVLVPALELRPLGGAQILDGGHDDPFRGEGGAERLLPDPGLLGVQVEDAGAGLGERLLRQPAVGRAYGDTRGRLSGETGDPDHEELVEHQREDGAEPHALEQRQVLVGREREHAGVVVEERELPVDQPVDGGERPLLRPDRSHRTDHDTRSAGFAKGCGLVTKRRSRSRPPCRRRRSRPRTASASGSRNTA